LATGFFALSVVLVDVDFFVVAMSILLRVQTTIHSSGTGSANQSNSYPLIR